MIYLDYAATSLKRKEVLTNLFENLAQCDGNTSSSHALGRSASKQLEVARKKIAQSINCLPKDLLFTSGASESNNTIIKQFDNKDFEIISTNIEHKSIIETLKYSKAQVVYLSANEQGSVSLADLKEKISGTTKLVAIMYVNNELGTIQNIEEIGKYLADKDIHFHVDAVQAFGHIEIDVAKIACDSLSLSGHKIGGLNGIGVLFVKSKIKPLILGGNQEHKRRAGTTNVLAALSMANCIEKIYAEQANITALKSYFLALLQAQNIPFEINGSLENAVNHILNLYFPFVKNDLFLTYLDMHGVCVSAGSACLAGTLEPSYVIANVYGKVRAEHSIRFSFGFSNTKKELEKVSGLILKIYKRKEDV